MGINLNNSSEFDETLFRLQQSRANSSTIVTTEAAFIAALEQADPLNRELTGTIGMYRAPEEEVEEGETLVIPTSSPVSNFRLSSTRTETEEAIIDDQKYLKTYKVLTFTHIVNYQASDSIWTNDARIIYHRKVCYYSTIPDPIDDGYRGSETIIVTYPFSQEVEDEPIPINPITYGAFPSGVSGEYCLLACKIDETFANNYSLTSLNEYANAYQQRIDPNTPTTEYFGHDANGNYVYVVKSTVDEEDEVLADWEDLYPSTTLALTNDVVNQSIIIEGQETIVPCYKIYLAGKCQLLDIDGDSWIDDIVDHGGQREIERFDVPNGYYVIINKKMYLFLLTDFNTADWPYTYQSHDYPDKINFSQHTSLGSGIKDITGRTIYENGNYYIYKGHSTGNITGVTGNTVILSDQGVSTLRHVVFSDTITSLGHFGAPANPDEGFEFPKHLQYIGPLTIGYSANTHIWVYADELTEISDNAFYITPQESENAKIYIANIEEIEILKSQSYRESHGLTGGYIAPCSTLMRVGENAFYKLKTNYINLTKCVNLSDVGYQAFAVDTRNKQFYFRDVQLSDRNGVSANKIYLPDECQDEVNNPLPIDESYNTATYTSNTYKTLGTALNGYHIHVRNSVVTLNDIFT